MNHTLRTAALTGALALAACGPDVPPQYLIHLATDAPVPNDPPEEDAPPALFDRVLLEVYRAGEQTPCDGCVRELVLSTALLRAGVSLGVVLPEDTDGHRVRARMYSSQVARTNPPDPRNVVDEYVALPKLSADDGVVSITLQLRTERVGIEADPNNPGPARRGEPDPDWTGSWPGAKAQPCTLPAPERSVCVPGGAFWMGGAERDTVASPAAPDVAATLLVVVSPYYLEETEVTVGQLRASGILLGTDREKHGPIPRSGTDPDQHRYYFGTWADSDEAWPFESASEQLPVNLISSDLARTYCQSRGGDLPTEAQFEFAAGGRESRVYLWGTSDPSCDDAVWGRGPTGFWSDCLRDGQVGGAKPPKSGARDVLQLEGGRIYDLAGNMSEWVQDTWNRQNEGCWLPTLQYDPVCTTPRSPGEQTVYTARGGNWALSGGTLGPHSRTGLSKVTWRTYGPGIGLRCAWPGR